MTLVTLRATTVAAGLPRRAIKQTLPLAGLLLLAGCPGPALRPYPPPQVADVLGQLRSSHSMLLSMRARAKADYLDDQAGRVKVDVSLLLGRPDQLRLAAENSLTGPLVTLATDGKDYQLLDVQRNRFSRGTVSPCSMAQLIRVALHPSEAVEVLMGGVPLLHGAQVKAELAWATRGGGREVLTLRDDSGQSQELSLQASGSGWDVREAEGRSSSGQVLWRVRHEDFTNVPLKGEASGAVETLGTPTVRLPQVTYIEDPAHKADVRLRWRERELNPTLEPALFHLEQPSGIPLEPDVCSGLSTGSGAETAPTRDSPIPTPASPPAP